MVSQWRTVVVVVLTLLSIGFCQPSNLFEPRCEADWTHPCPLKNMNSGRRTSLEKRVELMCQEVNPILKCYEDNAEKIVNRFRKCEVLNPFESAVSRYMKEVHRFEHIRDILCSGDTEDAIDDLRCTEDVPAPPEHCVKAAFEGKNFRARDLFHKTPNTPTIPEMCSIVDGVYNCSVKEGRSRCPNLSTPVNEVRNDMMIREKFNYEGNCRQTPDARREKSLPNK